MTASRACSRAEWIFHSQCVILLLLLFLNFVGRRTRSSLFECNDKTNRFQILLTVFSGLQVEYMKKIGIRIGRKYFRKIFAKKIYRYLLNVNIYISSYRIYYWNGIKRCLGWGIQKVTLVVVSTIIYNLFERV